MLLRYEYFCTNIPILYSCIMGCHGKHVISKIVNEYDQEIPQSHTADNPVAP